MGITSEVLERKGLTFRVLIVGLAIVAITTAYFNLFLRSGTGGVPWGPEYALDFLRHKIPGINSDHTILRNSTSWPITLGFFMTINILGAYLMKLTKGKRVISIELIVLSTMIATSFFYFWPNGPNCEWGRDASSWGGVATGLSLYQGNAEPEVWAILPNIICPNDPAVYEAIVPTAYGWTIHPAFYPSIVWSILFWGSNTFFFVFLAMICKVLWFDVESISPTWVEIQHQSLVLVTGESSERSGSSGRVSGRLAWFLIGFLISAVFTILEYGYTLVADISDVTTMVSYARNGYLLGTDIVIAPMTDASMLGIIPWVPLFLSFLPYQIGFAFVLPLDLLYSVAVGYLIFNMVIPVSLTSAGILPPYEPGLDFRSVAGRFMGDAFVGADGVNAWTNGLYTCTIQGLLIGLMIYPFIRYRKRTIPLFKALYKKADESLEALSPIPLRYVWIGLIMSAIIWFGCWAATGAYMPVVIASLLVQTLMIGGSVRAGMYMAGINFMNDFTADCWYPAFWRVPSAYITLNAAPTPAANTGTWATFMATLRVQAFMGWITNQSQNMAWSLYTIKLGERLKVRRKDIGLALILSFIVIFLFAAPFYALRFHAFPWGPEGIGEAGDKYVVWDTFADPAANFEQGLWYGAPGIVEENFAMLGVMGGVQYMGYVALGFALVPLLMYLRRRISWFRILPEGIFLGAIIGYSYVIGPMILALVLKWVIFKAGLVDAYNEKLQPASMGLVMGFFIPWVIMFMVIAFYTSPATILWKLSQA